ncbi:formylglycine-generating enzyme family protein [Sphaerotilus sp.]|uniref:formylglycine-generating enzyme family protein n=1 Tax=Sphaerotilus sp. TaxID=2093942 RepID=UPI0025D5A3EA|nr:formylglycine-generating enzyme family protein [Sphaerotilus sp.]
MNAGAVGWGDLLRMRHALPEAQWLDAAGALGFAPAVESAKVVGRGPGLRPPERPPEPPPGPSPPPLPPPDPPEVVDRMPYWRLASDLPDPEVSNEVPPWLAEAGQPGAEVFERDVSALAPPPFDVPPLVSPARLAACLRQRVAVLRHSGGPDVQRVVKHLARGRPLTDWPHRQQDRWPARVCLVLDVRRALWPLQEDLRRMAVQMETLLGERLQVLLGHGGPGAVCDLDGEPVDLPTDGRAVVVLGEIGMGQPGSVLHRRWCAWGQRQSRAGRRALLLVPVGRERVTREAAASFDVVPLDDRGPLRWVRPVGVNAAPDVGIAAADLEVLRAALFGNPCVSPGLLRELRCLLAAEGLALDVGSERALWQDAAISATACACTVVQEQREAVEAGFRALPPGLQAAVAGLHWRHLQSASPLIRAEYARGVRPLLAWQDSPTARALAQGEAAAEVLARQACAAMWHGDGEALASNLAAYLSRLGGRDLSQIQRGSPALQAAWVMAHREDLRTGRLAVPQGVDAQAACWVFAGAAALPRLALTCWMAAPGRAMLRVAPDQELAPTVARLAVTPGALEWRLDGQRLRVGEAVALSSVQRVHEVRCGGRVLLVERFEPAEEALSRGRDEWGWWVEFTVKGRRGPITQRLRWIAPGEFLMGSPESEYERSSSERQHPVVLTQGYWLADTACTQELWEAVMGENPSRFKGDPQNPVEQVSWNDITEKFLPKLNELVPGLNLTLPTEAQWENGCRAGMTTPFSFGEHITTDQVNYDEQFPYAGGMKNQYYERDWRYPMARKKTLPVKELPANQWGLHQMHGNVWEWCQDDYGEYSEGTSIDPVVHQDRNEGRQRVLRGGSWFNNGRSCRSAERHANEPDHRDYGIGFRLARGFADQPDQHRKFFSQPESGGAKPPGISGIARNSESEAPPPGFFKRVLRRFRQDKP